LRSRTSGPGKEEQPLIAWFEQEVRPELAGIRRDLDELLLSIRHDANEIPRGKRSQQRCPSFTLNRTSLGDADNSSLPRTKTNFSRAKSSASHLSYNSALSTPRPASALETVLSHPPDDPKLQMVKSQTWSLKDALQIMPPLDEGAAAVVSGERDSISGKGSITSDSEPVDRSSLSSNMTEKEMEKAEVLSRFQRHGLGLKIFERVWNVLENPESSTAARWCARIMPAYIISTVCLTLLQSVDPPPLHGVPAAVIETTIDGIFLLEFLVRFIVCPNHWTFWLDVYNLIDLAAAAPLALRASIGPVLPLPGSDPMDLGLVLLFFGVPTIRMLKLLRRFKKFHLLLNAFHLAAEALPVLLFMLFDIQLVFSVIIYLVEPRDNIPSLSTAIWLTMVTMTTVGYGDVTPKSAAGSVVTGVLVVVTVLYMAIPLGIIGNAFTITWSERDRILLMQRTRDRLRQWGYTAHDIPVLFRLSDSDDNGELDVTEFRDLLRSMQIGFSDERIFQLFESFDQDRSGSVDDREFVRALFPSSYHEIYRDEGAS